MIYIVWAKSSSPRDTIVGYATGEKKDIEAYYHKRAEYGIYFEELRITNVCAGYADKHKRITEQVLNLRNTAAKLERELDSPESI